MVWLFVTLSLLPICLSETGDSPFQIRLTNRNGNSNSVTLECVLTATSQPIPDAMYFLNGSRLENFTELQSDANPGVTFQIQRDIEGYFSCGNDSIMSSPMGLIG